MNGSIVDLLHNFSNVVELLRVCTTNWINGIWALTITAITTYLAAQLFTADANVVLQDAKQLTAKTTQWHDRFICWQNTVATYSSVLKGRGKGRVQLLMKLHLTATVCHLPYGMTRCYLTQVNTHCLNPSQTGWHSIYLPWRDGRLSSHE